MKHFSDILKAHFEQMCKGGKLFRADVSGQEVWEAYIASFENDPIFRDPESSEHNCNLCNNFIRHYGNIVSIDENFKTVSIFDVKVEGEYENTVKVLSELIKSRKVRDVFFETYDSLNSLNYESCSKNSKTFKLGLEKNHKRYTKEEAEKFGVVKADEVRTFHHLNLDLPSAFVNTTGKSIEAIMNDYRAPKDVFQRAMEEIPLDTLNLVRDLIKQGSLLDGEAHLRKVEEFIPLKKEYDELAKNQRDNWCWVKSYKLPFAKFKNELIGVLCSELAEGEELNKACQSWNKRVDPANYMKAVAPITKRQVEEAQKFVEENGYTESFDRRFATIEDIKVSEILHINSGDNKIKTVSIFDNVKTASTRHKRSEFDNVEEVSIEKFMKDILPTCTGVEALLKNNHLGNMVSLTTANQTDSKPIFKWDNNYSWTYNGNLAGKSQIKDAVKSRGGNVEGVVRVSLAFPNTTDDYDLHMKEANGNVINFHNVRTKQLSSGMLDLDAQGVDGHQAPNKRVENIIYTDKSSMPKGKYEISVNNYSRRGLHTPFTLEIEIEGEITLLELDGKKSNDWILAGTIEFDGNSFKVTEASGMKILESTSVSQEVYGLETNSFHKVNLVCLSPNHWNGNNVGNKHYFFMLDGCKVPTSIRSFHNENLISDLLTHRKVMEVLGATNMIEPAEKQLSGLGFNATVREELVVRLSGTHKRVLKIKF